MACADNLSNITIRIDNQDRFVSFSFRRMVCGGAVTDNTGLQAYCQGRNAFDIINLDFASVVQDLQAENEEQQFFLYLEWDALRSALARFLGVEQDNLDTERCMVLSVKHYEDGMEISEVILPPRDIPQLLSCQIEK